MTTPLVDDPTVRRRVEAGDSPRSRTGAGGARTGERGTDMAALRNESAPMSSTPPSTPPGVGVLGRATAAIAGASARRPKTVIVLWLVLIAGLVFAGTTVGTKSLTEATERRRRVGEGRRRSWTAPTSAIPPSRACSSAPATVRPPPEATADITRRAREAPRRSRGASAAHRDVEVPLHRRREDHTGPGRPCAATRRRRASTSTDWKSAVADSGTANPGASRPGRRPRHDRRDDRPDRREGPAEGGDRSRCRSRS